MIYSSSPNELNINVKFPRQAKTKICKACGKEKLLVAFYKNSSTLDGKEHKCIECSKKRRAQIKQAKEISKINVQTTSSTLNELSANVKTSRQTKICKVCGKEKPLSSFYVNNTYLDGKDCRCKECEGLRRRAQHKQAAAKSKIEEANAFSVTDLSDNFLIDEMRKRGYSGTLHLTQRTEYVV